MPEGTKRKHAPGGEGKQVAKKKKGKWTTSHQELNASLSRGEHPQPGDAGVWVTCARGQESRAVREVMDLFEEYAELLYGIKPNGAMGGHSEDDDAVDDIETAIKKEIAAMSEHKGASDDKIFKPFRMDLSCLLFVKTKPPIESVEFVRRICADANSPSRAIKTRSRYLNRLTPIAASSKATEQGLIDLARLVLHPVFDLSGRTRDKEAGASTQGVAVPSEEEGDRDAANDGQALTTAMAGMPGRDGTLKPCSFAIRTTIRNHNKLSRDTVIEQVAGLINDGKHKVDLKSPDKVILVEIYKMVCGMSVVDGGEWEKLKRYNLTALNIVPTDCDEA